MCTALATIMERCKYGDESCHCAVAGRGPGNNGGAGGGSGGTGGGGTGGGGTAGGGTAGGGGGGAEVAGRWTCTAGCPSDEPTVGADCTQNAVCPYTGGACACGQSKKWQCAGAMLGGGGANGTAGAGGMSAGGAGVGDNNGTMCPMQKPKAGGTCAGTGACTYPNKTGCACVSDKWLCD